MAYITTLSAEQKTNISYLVDAMIEAGITSPISQASILAIISKESAFIPKSEKMNYTANRIVTVFKLSYSEAEKLAGKPEALANRVYNKYGNTEYGDGWKYRGRGYNQLTFKGNYKKYGDAIGVDLVSNPDKANDPKVASKIAVQFAKNGIESLKSQGKLSQYNSNDINDFKNQKDSTLAFYHANAGTGKSVERIKALVTNDTVGGMTKALARVGDLFNFIKTDVKKKPTKYLMNGLLIGIGLLAGWILIKKFKKNAKV